MLSWPTRWRSQVLETLARYAARRLRWTSEALIFAHHRERIGWAIVIQRRWHLVHQYLWTLWWRTSLRSDAKFRKFYCSRSSRRHPYSTFSYVNSWGGSCIASCWTSRWDRRFLQSRPCFLRYSLWRRLTWHFFYNCTPYRESCQSDLGQTFWKDRTCKDWLVLLTWTVQPFALSTSSLFPRTLHWEPCQQPRNAFKNEKHFLCLLKEQVWWKVTMTGWSLGDTKLLSVAAPHLWPRLSSSPLLRKHSWSSSSKGEDSSEGPLLSILREDGHSGSVWQLRASEEHKELSS